MLKIGNKIRLTAKEQAFLGICADCAYETRTMEELMTWIAFAKTNFDSSEPECRLLTALLDMLARDEFTRNPTSL